MFDVVRNNRRIVQVFLALITLPFAFWGVESYLRNAASGDDVAVVGGSKIAAREFQQALQAQILEWSAKAELAIQKGREDLARAALTEKLAEVKKCEQLEQEKARVPEVLAQLTADSERLASKLTEAREKQKLLTLREQTAHSRIRARAQVDNQRMHELMARFEGFQGRVDQLEAQLEAATLGQNPSLEAQFRELELNDEIERELARLKGQKVEA